MRREKRDKEDSLRNLLRGSREKYMYIPKDKYSSRTSKQRLAQLYASSALPATATDACFNCTAAITHYVINMTVRQRCLQYTNHYHHRRRRQSRLGRTRDNVC